MAPIARTGAPAALIIGICLCSAVAHGLSPADKCASSELKTSGKYSFCRLKAEANAVKTATTPDYSKCDATFADKFGKADMKGMGQCPSSATQAELQAHLTQCSDDVAAALAGGPLPDCPGDLATCQGDVANCQAKLPPLATGQTTAFGTGTDGDLQLGASQSFTDNGDGTITDNTTGLMWEKKSDDGSIHDKDDTYTWCVDVSPKDYFCDNGTNAMDGTIVATFLATLNALGGFAGDADWRIPNVNELASIVNLDNLFENRFESNLR